MPNRTITIELEVFIIEDEASTDGVEYVSKDGSDTPKEIADRVADDITKVLSVAGISASITPLSIAEEGSDPVDLGNRI